MVYGQVRFFSAPPLARNSRFACASLSSLIAWNTQKNYACSAGYMYGLDTICCDKRPLWCRSPQRDDKSSYFPTVLHVFYYLVSPGPRKSQLWNRIVRNQTDLLAQGLSLARIYSPLIRVWPELWAVIAVAFRPHRILLPFRATTYRLVVQMLFQLLNLMR